MTVLNNVLKKFLLRFSPIFKYQISGHSMSPTFADKQIILVNRLAYFFKPPRVGDIIAARIDKKVFIKRITKIEDKRFFLRGDNSSDSFDSRKFGMISKGQIIGKVY